jgi:hypothetical protein
VLILKTWDGDDWEQHPWRAIRLIKGAAFKTNEGGTAIRVPDIEWIDKTDARRTDPDTNESFPFAATYKEGTGWTFGRDGTLKGKVQVVQIMRE